MTTRYKYILSSWMLLVLFTIMGTVLVGGVTRLTNSGLSITEWQPLIGAIPPMNEAEWNEVFEKYKQIPEYSVEHSHMELEDFKFIFFWEWLHRNFGRAVGLVALLPFLFLFRKLDTSLRKRIGTGIILIGLQGALGWFMVKSGLSERVDVSHYRLAAHLILAFFIFSHFLKILIDILVTDKWKTQFVVNRRFRWVLVIIHSLLGFQIIWGAFVAGLRAGYMYNTFPKMGDQWIPLDALFLPSVFIAIVENPITVQFIHRWLAVIVLLSAFFLPWYALRQGLVRQRLGFMWVYAGLVVCQFLLGVFTLILKMPIALASLHQVVGLITFGSMSVMMHLYQRQIVSVESRS